MPNSIKIRHCNYRQLLKTVDDRSVSLAIIDPPYNLKVDSWDDFGSQEKFQRFTYDWVDRVIPKLKKTGSLYVFNTPLNSAFICQYLLGKKMFFQNWITWDKRDGFSYAKRRFAGGQETILFFTKSDRHTFNHDSVRVPYESKQRMIHAKHKGIIKNGRRWYPDPRGRLCGDVWHIVSERHKNKIGGRVQKLPHKTIKPLEMIERMVLASSKRNDLVLDCFLGSGTTACVCKKLGRSFIGGDADRDYVLNAKIRVKNGGVF